MSRGGWGQGPLSPEVCFRCRGCHLRGWGGLPVQTQRRCSSKGSSVDSSRGVGWSPVVGGVGSDI